MFYNCSINLIFLTYVVSSISFFFFFFSSGDTINYASVLQLNVEIKSYTCVKIWSLFVTHVYAQLRKEFTYQKIQALVKEELAKLVRKLDEHFSFVLCKGNFRCVLGFSIQAILKPNTCV